MFTSIIVRPQYSDDVISFRQLHRIVETAHSLAGKHAMIHRDAMIIISTRSSEYLLVPEELVHRAFPTRSWHNAYSWILFFVRLWCMEAVCQLVTVFERKMPLNVLGRFGCQIIVSGFKQLALKVVFPSDSCFVVCRLSRNAVFLRMIFAKYRIQMNRLRRLRLPWRHSCEK